MLNVLEPYVQAEVMMNVTNLLAFTGTAFFAVRRDGFRLHAIIASTPISVMCGCLSRVWNVMRTMSFISISISISCHGRKGRFVLSAVCRGEWKLFVRRLLVCKHPIKYTL